MVSGVRFPILGFLHAAHFIFRIMTMRLMFLCFVAIVCFLNGWIWAGIIILILGAVLP